MAVRRTRLVPELVVVDLARSLIFWRDLIGFRVLYERPEDPFAYLGLDEAEVMLDQYVEDGRTWLTRPFEPPRGNGINLQIGVDAVAPILGRLGDSGWPLFMPVEDR